MERERRRRLKIALVLTLFLIKRRRRSHHRSVWIRPIFTRRQQQGEYHQLLQEMRLLDPESHFRYLRMSRERFDRLLVMVAPMISHRGYSSSLRAAITPAERLALTIRYLATGNSQVSLSFNFRIGRSSVCNILRETCEAIWNALQDQYLHVPSTTEEWLTISREFQQRWNFPNCIGAIDGKHVVIQAPYNAGSNYFNYKGSHSIVLMAVCDAQYRFTVVDIGDAGRHSDGGVFANSQFGQALYEGTLLIPDDKPLPGTMQPDFPFVIVGDAAFPLKRNMMRPFPGKNLSREKAIFNYRLSRARRIIENCFGILAARWRIFRRPIVAEPSNVILFTKAAIALHNYLRTEESSAYCPTGFVDGEDGSGNVISGSWREEEPGTGLTLLGSVSGNRHSRSAGDVRDSFASYFMTPNGEVSWQYRHVSRTD